MRFFFCCCFLNLKNNKQKGVYFCAISDCCPYMSNILDSGGGGMKSVSRVANLKHVGLPLGKAGFTHLF